MHPLHELPVPVLRRLVPRPPDGVNLDLYPLPLELGHFPVAKRLAEGGEPLEKVSDLAHCRNSMPDAADATLWSRHALLPVLFRIRILPCRSRDCGSRP